MSCASSAKPANPLGIPAAMVFSFNPCSLYLGACSFLYGVWGLELPKRPLWMVIWSMVFQTGRDSEHEHRTLALGARATSRLVPWNPGRGHPGLGLRTGQKHHSPASCWPWLPGQNTMCTRALPKAAALERHAPHHHPQRPLWKLQTPDPMKERTMNVDYFQQIASLV